MLTLIPNTVTRDSQNTFESEINGQRVSSSVYVEGPTLVTDEGIRKMGVQDNWTMWISLSGEVV